MAKEPNWTSQEDEILKQHYGTITAKEIFNQGLIPGRTWIGIRSRAKGLKLRSNLRQLTHSFDENFWKVPNPLNAYWAGMLAADGALMKLKNKNITMVLQLALSTRDIGHLEKFKSDTGYSGEIKSYDAICTISRYKTKISMSYVRICQMWKCEKELKEIWGIIPRKTHRLALPNLSNDFLKLCYLCGYIDGDGSVTGDYNKNIPCLSISSSSKSIVDWFELITNNIFACHLRQSDGSLTFEVKNEHYWVFSVSSFRAAKIIDILSRLPVPKMDRKWKNPRILAMIEKFKINYPNEWSRRLPIEDEIDAFLSSRPVVSALIEC